MNTNITVKTTKPEFFCKQDLFILRYGSNQRSKKKTCYIKVPMLTDLYRIRQRCDKSLPYSPFIL